MQEPSVLQYYPSPRAARTIMAWVCIACAINSALAVRTPWAAACVGAGGMLAIALICIRGPLRIRLMHMLPETTICFLCAWLTKSLCDSSAPDTVLPHLIHEGIGVFLLWAGGLSTSAVIASYLCVPHSDVFQRRGFLFRVMLYLEQTSVGILICLGDRAHVAFPPAIITCTIFLFVSYVALGCVYRAYIRKHAEQEVRTDRLLADIEKQKAEFEQLSAELAVVRRTRHDFNNHLMVVSSLMREGNRNEAHEYMQALAQSVRAQAEAERAGTGETLAMSLARSKTQALEDRGVRIRYPNVQIISPTERVFAWPWTAIIVDAAHETIKNSDEASLELYYAADPLRVIAVLGPADFDEVKRLIVQELPHLPNGTVQIGSSGKQENVRVVVLIDDTPGGR